MSLEGWIANAEHDPLLKLGLQSRRQIIENLGHGLYVFLHGLTIFQPQRKKNRPYHGFRRHRDGQAKRPEITVFIRESDSKQLLPKLNLTQFLNRNVIILGRRLYSPSLKDVT